MPESQLKDNSYERVSHKEFITLVKWAFSLVTSLVKENVIVYLITKTLYSFYGLINIYILTLILDKAVEVLQTESASIEVIYPLLGVLLGYNVLHGVINWLRLYSERAIEIKLRPRLNKALYVKLHSLGTQSLEQPGITNKITRAQDAMFQIIWYFYDAVEMFVSLVTLTVTFVLLLNAVPMVIPLIIAFAIPQFLYDKTFRRKAWKLGYDNTEGGRRAHLSAWALRDPKTLQEIMVSNAYSFLDRKYTFFTEWFIELQMNLRKKWFKGLFTFGVLMDLGIYLGYVMIFSQFLIKAITVGTVFFRIRLVDRLSRDVDIVLQKYSSLFERSLRMKDLYSLFVADPAFADGTERLPKLDKGPDIKITNLDFAYPRNESRVLNDITLNVKSGEKVAIVGHNGAGKTTLVKLLSRMYLPTDGEILVNDIAIKDIAIETLYQNMGVLFQEFNTYDHLSVKDNVVIGDTKRLYSEEDMVDALARADALDFVNSYPNKFDQILSEKFDGGIRPSWGQWQKIAIARFFYRNAPFVIFDEPTAAIDAVSEYNIFNKIYSFFEGKTVILISHRFSTVRNADRIIVLEKGRIIEEGSHEELMEKNGSYAESFKLQAEGYSIAS